MVDYVMGRDSDESARLLEIEREEKRKARNRRASANRKARDDAMRSLGLVKCKGAVSGRTYWE